MKRNFKRRFMTGVAAIALVAPLVLGGLNNNVHAANTSAATHEENMIHNGSLKNGALGAANPNAGANAGNNIINNSQSGNSSQLAAIQTQIQSQESILQSNLTQARNQYKKLPKAQQKAQLKTLNAKLQKQRQPVLQKITDLQKKYNQTMTPAQRKQTQEKQKAAQQKQSAAKQKQMKQLQAQMKAQQKKEQKQMLKTAQTIFVIQGKKVYTLRTDVTKNKQNQEQLQPIPGINKKYYSTKKAFAKKQLKEIRRAHAMALSAKKLHGKTARKNAMKKANNLLMQYARVASMPTKKQQQAKEKKAAKQQKKSQRKNTSRKTNRKSKAKVRKNTKRKKTPKRTRRSKTVRKNQRQSRTFKKDGVTVLRSEYHRGSNRKAKAAGFVNGHAYPDGIHTIFNRYQPNSKRAILPKNLHIYKVNPKHITKNGNATAWLVGRRTNSEKKISNMKQAYYYNTGYHGWLNIGKPSQLKK